MQIIANSELGMPSWWAKKEKKIPSEMKTLKSKRGINSMFRWPRGGVYEQIKPMSSFIMRKCRCETMSGGQ